MSSHYGADLETIGEHGPASDGSAADDYSADDSGTTELTIALSPFGVSVRRVDDRSEFERHFGFDDDAPWSVVSVVAEAIEAMLISPLLGDPEDEAAA